MPREIGSLGVSISNSEHEFHGQLEVMSALNALVGDAAGGSYYQWRSSHAYGLFLPDWPDERLPPHQRLIYLRRGL